MSEPIANRTPSPATMSDAGAKIWDAVVTDDGDQWICFGTITKSTWFSLAELRNEPKDVFNRISGPGFNPLTRNSQDNFKKKIERHNDYRPGVVADHPGWIPGHPIFVTGAGRVLLPRIGSDKEIIVAFVVDPKFEPEGTVGGWKCRVGPIVKGQALPLFALFFSFTGPLLRFAPSHVINLICEIVGAHESGKSTIAFAGASVWAGDRDRDTAGGESWDMTLNYIDKLKLKHADCLLVLDEENLAGENRGARSDLISKAVFKLATTGGKKRLTDKAAPPDVRLSVMSTSNEPLGELSTAPRAERKALQSRIMTIRVAQAAPTGVLSHLPQKSDSKAAIDTLRSRIDEHYGKPGLRFLQYVVKAVQKDEKLFRTRIIDLLAKFEASTVGRAAAKSSARHLTLLAMTYVAGTLAQEWKIIPKSWGSVEKALAEVLRMTDSLETSMANPRDKLAAYLATHKRQFVKIDAVKSPIPRPELEATPGLLQDRDGQEELLIPSPRFQAEFPEHRTLVNDLRNVFRTEGGKTPKHTIKAPKGICSGARVYCVRLSKL